MREGGANQEMHTGRRNKSEKRQFDVDAPARASAQMAMKIQAKANDQFGLSPTVAEAFLIFKREVLCDHV
jgi:hypothetical protein